MLHYFELSLKPIFKVFIIDKKTKIKTAPTNFTYKRVTDVIWEEHHMLDGNVILFMSLVIKLSPVIDYIQEECLCIKISVFFVMDP